MKKACCKTKFLGVVVASFMLFFTPLTAHSVPLIWETDFGGVLTGFVDDDGDPDIDDGQVSRSLSFGFTFAGFTYTEIFVGTNGGLKLGSLGGEDEIDHDIWSDFHEFIDDNAPFICPFCSDLDLGAMGTVHFNDFGDHAVVTWNEVGSFENEFAPFTFQTQLLDNGQIIMAWDGIPNDLQDDLSGGIVIGITTGDDPDPGTNHFLSDAPFSGGTTIYEIWCFDNISDCGNIDGDQENPTSGFSLDGEALIFTPDGPGDYDVALAISAPSPGPAPAPVPEPGTLLLLATGLVGLVGYRRFKKR